MTTSCALSPTRRPPRSPDETWCAITVSEIPAFFYRRISMRVFLALFVALFALASSSPAFAQRALSNETLIDYIRARDDLPAKDRKKWEAEIKKKFGGEALNEESEIAIEISVAKSI